MSNQPSLKAVAELAGVGFGTASRALSGRGSVAPETKQRVLDAAAKLNYVPSALGRSLRENSSPLVGVILPDLRNEFYNNATEVIHEELAKASYQMLISSARGATAQNQAFEMMASYKVAGIIVVPDIGSKPVTNIPVVQLTRSVYENTASLVACDDRAGFFELASLVIKRNPGRVAAILGEESMSTTKLRAEGIRAAAEATGCKVDLRYGTYTAESGREIMAQLLDDELPPRSVIVGSPRIMAGVAQVIRQRELAVPGEIAVAGFDDPEWYSFIGPGITTFVPPHEEMAREAVRIILDSHSTKTPETTHVVLPGTIIQRGSA
ncbi:LacI family DNA-binding transcriptional regulator [Corynebacterium sp. S7]